MPADPEFRFSILASATIAAAALAGCGGPHHPTGAATDCTIALSASTDDAPFQAAIENALRQDPCTVPDPPLRAVARIGPTQADARTHYEFVRVERDEKSVRAVFRAVPETRSAETGE